jgi:hypothetical protein
MIYYRHTNEANTPSKRLMEYPIAIVEHFRKPPVKALSQVPLM